jgi:hypothetical protein
VFALESFPKTSLSFARILGDSQGLTRVGLWAVLVVMHEHCGHRRLAFAGHSSESGTRDFRDHLVSVQHGQEPSHFLALTLTVAVAQRGRKQLIADIRVAESLQEMLATHHGSQQVHVLLAGGIQCSVAATCCVDSASRTTHLLSGTV